MSSTTDADNKTTGFEFDALSRTTGVIDALNQHYRHRVALSSVYEIPAWKDSGFLGSVTKNWRLSAIYQAQSGFPFIISVFGDTANAGSRGGFQRLQSHESWDAQSFRKYATVWDHH
jgi:YD repeat-containing protein